MSETGKWTKAYRRWYMKRYWRQYVKRKTIAAREEERWAVSPVLFRSASFDCPKCCGRLSQEASDQWHCLNCGKVIWTRPYRASQDSGIKHWERQPYDAAFEERGCVRRLGVNIG